MSDRTWLEIAADITTGERRRDYGRPLLNFLRIAIRWSNYLGHYVSPVDVVMMMVDLKIARQQQTYKDDNGIDIIGYVACWDDMDRTMKSMGYEHGLQNFEGQDVHYLQEKYVEVMEFVGHQIVEEYIKENAGQKYITVDAR